MVWPLFYHRQRIPAITYFKLSPTNIIQQIFGRFRGIYAFDFCAQCNYRSGRWRSEYTVDLTQNQITGRILINIHYYEQGNVSMVANEAVSLKADEN